MYDSFTNTCKHMHRVRRTELMGGVADFMRGAGQTCWGNHKFGPPDVCRHWQLTSFAIHIQNRPYVYAVDGPRWNALVSAATQTK